ncbi:MAG: hypothetical protein M3252_06325, partial [Actinomycetota bacterium]|nr:hypothetical protein [Actinomycetota bacterium]
MHQLYALRMLLVIAATEREASPLRDVIGSRHRGSVFGVEAWDGRLGHVPVRLAVCGLGRASTTFHVARLLLDRPQAVLQFGVGGAFPEGPPVGGVALATEDTYADLGVATEQRWLPADALGIPLLERDGTCYYDTFPCAAEATAAAAKNLDAPTGRFVTVETGTGTAARVHELAHRHRPLAESMEG